MLMSSSLAAVTAAACCSTAAAVSSRCWVLLLLLLRPLASCPPQPPSAPPPAAAGAGAAAAVVTTSPAAAALRHPLLPLLLRLPAVALVRSVLQPHAAALCDVQLCLGYRQPQPLQVGFKGEEVVGRVQGVRQCGKRLTQARA